MKQFLKTVLLLAIVATLSTSCGYERIDAGHVGIKVNLYGSDKGVDDITEVTGATWYNPFRTEVYEFPTYVQDVSYDDEDKLQLTTNDGLKVTIEVGLNYRVEQPSVSKIFRKYRKDLPTLEQQVLRKHVRDAFSSAIAAYSAEDSYAKKNELKQTAEENLKSTLQSEGFTIEKLSFLSDPQPPQSVMDNIELKINAEQTAFRKQKEVEQSKADAEKLIEKSRGEAESRRIKADAEKYEYEQKQRALTTLLVQQQFIEKWDGKLPQYGEVPQIFKSISGK